MFSFITSPAFALIKDELVDSTLKYEKLNTEDKRVEIYIEEFLTTRKRPEEGAYVYFVTTSDVKYNGKIYPAGTKIKARIETVSQNSVWGVPADIVISNFEMEGVPLCGEISKTGANRVLWVRPLSIIVGVVTGAGFFLIFLRGGHAKITPEEIFVVYLP